MKTCAQTCYVLVNLFGSVCYIHQTFFFFFGIHPCLAVEVFRIVGRVGKCYETLSSLGEESISLCVCVCVSVCVCAHNESWFCLKVFTYLFHAIYDHRCLIYWRVVSGNLSGIVIFMFQGFSMNQVQQEHDFPLVECKNSTSGVGNVAVHNMEGANSLDFQQFDMHQDFGNHYYTGFSGTGLCAEDGLPHISSYLPSMCPPPSAFLGPKCALWDCPRPAQGLDWCQDYCSSFHAGLALNEGPPGMGPVLRPGGIGLKDALLFAALGAKAQGKDVGIPECEGAATAKSPWNAPGKFILSCF